MEQKNKDLVARCEEYLNEMYSKLTDNQKKQYTHDLRYCQQTLDYYLDAFVSIGRLEQQEEKITKLLSKKYVALTVPILLLTYLSLIFFDSVSTANTFGIYVIFSFLFLFIILYLRDIKVRDITMHLETRKQLFYRDLSAFGLGFLAIDVANATQDKIKKTTASNPQVRMASMNSEVLRNLKLKFLLLEFVTGDRAFAPPSYLSDFEPFGYSAH